MLRSKIGTLEQINSPHVCIDGEWFDGSKIVKFLPQKINIQVEYSADENKLLSFIREKKAFEAPSFTGSTHNKPYTPKAVEASKNSLRSDSIGDSIIRQVVFKGAIELTKGFTFASPEEAVSTVSVIYEQLIVKYQNKLK